MTFRSTLFMLGKRALYRRQAFVLLHRLRRRESARQHAKLRTLPAPEYQAVDAALGFDQRAGHAVEPLVDLA